MKDTKWLGSSIVGIVQSLIKEKSKKIIENGGDCVLQLKANQKTFMKMYMQCLMINI